MSIATSEQQRINDAQAKLDADRLQAQKNATAMQHEMAKAVAEKLVGVPMHDTNVGEVAMVVLAVLEYRESHRDTAKSHGPAHAK